MSVEANQVVCVLQEMVISAPHSGVISTLQVKEGDSVDSQDLICKVVKS